MNPIPTTLDPKLRALPTEGMKEYIYWSTIYTEIRQSCLKILDILKRLQIQDPDNDYSDQIAETFGKAFLNDMNWEIRQRSILARHLRNDRANATIGGNISRI